jgi:imidazole glycerol-phosphate synthase subunit HisF
MKRARVIPVLLLKNRGLYKSVKFKNETYVGDPVNAVKIFNEKLCDELIFVDISASKQKKQVDYKFIEEIASECFMPFSYGGGINELQQVERLLTLGIEKIIVNTALFTKPAFITEAAKRFGSSTIVGSVDVKMSLSNQYHVYSHSGEDTRRIELMPFLKKIEEAGAGELMITSVDNDGMMNGYDLRLAEMISGQLTIPVAFCGGARDINDIKVLLKTTQVSAAVAGSFFVFQGRHRGVLISYPSPEEIGEI